MTTTEELKEVLGACEVCDFQRQGNFCIYHNCTILPSEKKRGCIHFQKERL